MRESQTQHAALIAHAKTMVKASAFPETAAVATVALQSLYAPVERPMMGELLDALTAALEWIDAVPDETPLPTMPGFDRDEVNQLMDSVRKSIGGKS